MDLLSISSLSVSTYIGVHSWEQRIKQRLLLDISFPLDITDCNEKLESTTDYDAVCKEVTHFIESNSFKLIETVALKTVEFIKEKFPVQQVTLRVSKPNAIKNAGNISISISR